MKYRVFAFSAAVAAAATGLLPATAMAASAHVATTPPGTSAGAGAGSTSGAEANNKNNVSVVVNLPKDVHWADINNKNVLVSNNGNELRAPAGYSYQNGALTGDNGQFYLIPDGSHQGIVYEPLRCQDGRYSAPKGGTNVVGGVIDGVLKACATVYDTAYRWISEFAGTGQTHGGSCY